MSAIAQMASRKAPVKTKAQGRPKANTTSGKPNTAAKPKDNGPKQGDAATQRLDELAAMGRFNAQSSPEQRMIAEENARRIEEERRAGLSAADRAIEDVNTIPDPTDPNGPIRQAGDRLINEARSMENQQFAADQEGQQRAEDLNDQVQASQESTTNDINDVLNDVNAQADDVQQAITDQKEEVKKIPDEVRTEFENLRDQFDTQVSTALDRTDADRDAALSRAEEGRSAALQAAVQGIQGNINNQVSKIQANQNLTSAQKASMIAQVKLQGASSLAPAVGANVLAFNQLSADVATKFGAIAGQIQTQGLAGQQSLATAQGQAVAAATTASAQMTDDLISLQSSSAVSFANSQNQLIATRAQAENSADDLMRLILPERDTPVADFTASNSASLDFEAGMWEKGANFELQRGGFNLQVEAIRSMQGTPAGNAWEAFFGGLAQGGLFQGIVQGVGSLVGSAFGPRT